MNRMTDKTSEEIKEMAKGFIEAAKKDFERNGAKFSDEAYQVAEVMFFAGYSKAQMDAARENDEQNY